MVYTEIDETIGHRIKRSQVRFVICTCRLNIHYRLWLGGCDSHSFTHIINVQCLGRHITQQKHSLDRDLRQLFDLTFSRIAGTHFMGWWSHSVIITRLCIVNSRKSRHSLARITQCMCSDIQYSMKLSLYQLPFSTGNNPRKDPIKNDYLTDQP